MEATATGTFGRHVWLRREPKPSPIFETYWRFAAERQRIFHARAAGLPPPWTDDPILSTHRFTNAYRASDRVSQYLINVVIPGSHRDPRDICFRVLLFKIFNRLDTWHFLERSFGTIHIDTYSVGRYADALTRRLQARERVYSAAYIMPTPHTHGPVTHKHEAHLLLLRAMLNDGLPDRLAHAESLQSVFETLVAYPSLGPFLAFQYAIDLNYSPIINFDEMEFVVAGPGARSGIAKCFSDLAGWDYADIIRWTAERANDEFTRLEIDFMDLWGRPLQLVDCQNLFCEVDKYARVAHPEVVTSSGRTRIKQTYKPDPNPVTYAYPPKWGIDPLIGCETIGTFIENPAQRTR